MKIYDRTEQQMFDAVVAHARQQGRKSYEISSVSEYHAYRSSDGCKCFIGALIDDLPKEIVGNPTNRQLGLAIALQNAHDLYDVETWEEKFRELAKEFSLIYTPPQENRQ